MKKFRILLVKNELGDERTFKRPIYVFTRELEVVEDNKSLLVIFDDGDYVELPRIDISDIGLNTDIVVNNDILKLKYSYLVSQSINWKLYLKKSVHLEQIDKEISSNENNFILCLYQW